MRYSQLLALPLVALTFSATLASAMPPEPPKIKVTRFQPPASVPAPTTTPARTTDGSKPAAPNQEQDGKNTTATLKVGDKLPDLTLKNTKNEDVKTSTLFAKQPIVLTVYRGGWCPYCNTNLKKWQDKLQAVTNLDAAIIAVSPESPEHVAETIGKDKLGYTVLSDSTGVAGKALGLNFTLDQNTQRKYKGMGIDLSKHNANGTWDLPHPATFVVDTTGTIRYLFMNEDYKKRANIDDVIAALAAIKADAAKPTADQPKK